MLTSVDCRLGSCEVLLSVPAMLCVTCACCQEDTSQRAVEAIQADRTSEAFPALTLESFAAAAFETRAERAESQNHQRDEAFVQEHGVEASLKEVSAPHSQQATAPLSPEQKADGAEVKLTFQLRNGLLKHIYFSSRPLRVRFSKTLPLTVTDVGSDCTGSSGVPVDSVLTHVNDVPTSDEAINELRNAISHLPQESAETPVRRRKRRSSSEPPSSRQSHFAQKRSNTDHFSETLGTLPRTASLEVSLLSFNQNPQRLRGIAANLQAAR